MHCQCMNRVHQGSDSRTVGCTREWPIWCSIVYTKVLASWSCGQKLTQGWLSPLLFYLY